MPNWSYNSLIVNADPETIKQIVSDTIITSKDGKQQFTYSKIIPVPESIKDKEPECSTGCGEILKVGYYLPSMATAEEVKKIEEDIKTHSSSDAIEYLKGKAHTLATNGWDNTFCMVARVVDTYLLNNPDATTITFGELCDLLLNDKIKAVNERVQVSIDSAKSALLAFDGVMDNLRTHGYKNEYFWRVSNWGVKWDAHTNEIDIGDTFLQISFDSPWGTPDPFLLALSKKYPEAAFDFSYFNEDGYNEIYSFELVNGVISNEVTEDRPTYDMFGFEVPNNNNATDKTFGSWIYVGYDGTFRFVNYPTLGEFTGKLDYLPDNKGWKITYSLSPVSSIYNSPIAPFVTLDTFDSDPQKNPLDAIKDDLVKSKDTIFKTFGRLIAFEKQPDAESGNDTAPF